jgi:hypothetical protein
LDGNKPLILLLYECILQPLTASTLYTTDGKTDIVFFEKPQISVKELQESVNGYFEFIYLPNNMILVVNEEGKLNNLAKNEIATLFVSPILNDIILGDVLLINNKYIN